MVNRMSSYFPKGGHSETIYVGHPISSDNGLTSQKLLLISKLYYQLHVAMGVAY